MPLDTFVLLVLVNTNVLNPGTYRLRADEREIGEAVVRAKSENVLEFRFDVPVDAKRLSIERVRTLPLVGIALRPKIQTYDLINVESITKPLREERPVAALEKLSERVDTLLKTIGSELTPERLGLEFGQPQTAEAINQAEERLGFALDPALVEVLTKLGPLRFGDDGMTEAPEFERTEQQFQRIWGAPERVRDEDTRELYLNSTMVWVEAGDGYGAAIYAPEREDRPASDAAYWKIHQETIGEPMPLVSSAKGGPLSGMLMAVLAEPLLTQIEDQGQETQLFVDPSMPAAFPVWLFSASDGAPRLRPDWTRHY